MPTRSGMGNKNVFAPDGIIKWWQRPILWFLPTYWLPVSDTGYHIVYKVSRRKSLVVVTGILTTEELNGKYKPLKYKIIELISPFSHYEFQG